MTIYVDGHGFSTRFLMDDYRAARDLVHDPDRADDRLYQMVVALCGIPCAGAPITLHEAFRTALVIVTDEINALHSP